MNDELRELYQQVLLDHSRQPRNYGETKGEEVLHAHGDNPSCGDEIDVFLKLDETGVIETLTFTGAGCAISQASASMMTQKLRGIQATSALALMEDFRRVVTGDAEPENPQALGELQLLEGVQKFPQRVKCAMLAWRALQAAVQGDQESSVSSE